jgi:hypothetical protein
MSSAMLTLMLTLVHQKESNLVWCSRRKGQERRQIRQCLH